MPMSVMKLFLCAALLGSATCLADSYEACLAQLSPKYPSVAPLICRTCDAQRKLGLPPDEKCEETNVIVTPVEGDKPKPKNAAESTPGDR